MFAATEEHWSIVVWLAEKLGTFEFVLLGLAAFALVSLICGSVGALIVGKVVLIVDKFHFIDRYPDRPLIWNALWKTLIYNIAATAVHYLEKLLPLIFDGKGLAAANRTLFAATDWEHIVLIHMWLAVLLLAYCCARELVRAVGPDKVRHMFFHARGN